MVIKAQNRQVTKGLKMSGLATPFSSALLGNYELIQWGPPFRIPIYEPERRVGEKKRFHVRALHGQYVDFSRNCVMLNFSCSGAVGILNTCCMVSFSVAARWRFSLPK